MSWVLGVCVYTSAHVAMFLQCHGYCKKEGTCSSQKHFQCFEMSHLEGTADCISNKMTEAALEFYENGVWF